MSSRRLNRIGSRATESRRGSPPDILSEISSSTAQISHRRPENHVLPSVETKPSCAYGANSLAQPRKIVGPQSSEKLASVLHDILDPRIKASSPSARTRLSSSTPSKGKNSYSQSISDRSFSIESTIYRDASIESFIIDLTESSIPEDFSDYSEEGLDEATHPIACQVRHEPPEPEIIVRQVIEPLPIHQTPDSKYFTRIINKYGIFWLKYFLSRWLIIGAPLMAILLYTSSSKLSLSSVASYLPDNRPNIFLSNEGTLLRRRVGKLESDISIIDKRTSGIDFSAIKKLQQILPDNIVLKKENGIPQISDDLWKEILSRIKSETSVLEFASSQRGKIGSNISSYPTPDDNFLRVNEAKLRQLNDQNLTRQFPQLLQDNKIISKSEIIDLIAREKDKIFTDLEYSILRKMKSEITKARQQEINFPDAQLQATAKENIQTGITHDKMKINHFSKTMGALIDKRTTSPTYAFPSYAKMSNFGKVFRSMINNPVPTSLGPEAALSKWDEQGECWCVALDGKGFGPSLGVILGNKIFPEEVVIEHIPSKLSLEPGSIPKDFELLALIEDPEMELVIENESKKFFPEETFGPTEKLKGYVRIAAWVYESNPIWYIQKYEIPLDLKAFGVDTDHLIVRVKSNWSEKNVAYTCLYRVRLHGPISQPMVTP